MNPILVRCQLVACIVVATLGQFSLAQEGSETTSTQTESAFIKPTIDVGCVVSNIDESVKFYTKAIGFEVVGGFTIPAQFAADSGLTDKQAFSAKVLKLGKGENATSLKLIQLEGEKTKHDFINTSLGLSYLTIFVKSTDDALARLDKAGVKPVAKGPAVLPAELDASLALTIVRDPDGNLIELLGPKPQK